MHAQTVLENASLKSLQPSVAVVIPALNEGQIISQVVRELLALRQGGAKLVEHIFVCDNGSTDNTASEAAQAGATVVNAKLRGYGSACLAGLEAVAQLRPQPDIVLFADGDGSVLTSDVCSLIAQIEQGNDLVIGVRKFALQQRGALTPPQQAGNLVASVLIFALWRKWVSDLGPLRAVRTTALNRLNMADKTFGWTVEMQIKAMQAHMRVAEVPVSTKCRVGKSKISGTVSGVIGAARGIIGKIFALKIAEWKAPPHVTTVRIGLDASTPK